MFHDYFYMLKDYSTTHKITEDIITFTKIISIQNTPVHEMRRELGELENKFSNPKEVQKYVKWLERNVK